MKITITDPRLLAQLLAADDLVELADPSGRVVAVVARKRNPRPGSAPEFDRPTSNNELDTLFPGIPGGRSLKDIIRDLEDGDRWKGER